MAVGADQGVGVEHAVFGLVNAPRQVFQIDLVDDAKTGRHHAKGGKCLHAPFHELVALAVALELQLHVQVERLFAAVVVHHDGVVYHQIHGHQGFDFFGVMAQLGGHTAHGCQIGQQRHAGKVLQHHARDDKGNFVFALGLRLPLGQLRHMLGQDFAAITVAQYRFEHDANGYWQAPDAGKLLGQCGQGIKVPPFTGGRFQLFQGGGKCMRCGAMNGGGHGKLLGIGW